MRGPRCGGAVLAGAPGRPEKLLKPDPHGAHGDELLAGPESPVKPVRLGDARIHIGTSGWHYKHWIGDFYPERYPPAKMLSWYSREFHTVEINNSFYRLPEAKTFEEWGKGVPPGFMFAVKASRFLTHLKRLKDAADPIQLFFSRANHLREHLGPVLFQLPPKWRADVCRLREFLSVLPPNRQYSIEFRDDSWHTDAVYDLLRQHNIALCLHDWRALAWSHILTANFTYIRFHGTTGRYAGNYPEPLLRSWANKIQLWARDLSEVFAYFNNDVGGHAIRNARTLLGLLREVSNPPNLSISRPTSDQAA